MQDKVLETSPPPLDPGDARRLAATAYGLDADATPLESERDVNFRIDTADGAFVLKIGNVAEGTGPMAMQVAILERIATHDPTVPVPRVIPTTDGHRLTETVSGQGRHPVTLVSHLEGNPPPPPPSSPASRRSVGTTIARVSRAIRGFDHPAAHRHLLWDVTRLPELRPCLAFADPVLAPLLEDELNRYVSDVEPRLAELPRQVIHGDVHAGNILVDAKDPDVVVGLLDFGDCIWGPRVLDVAIAAAYQSFEVAPVDALVETTIAYNAIDPLLGAEVEVLADLALARLVQSHLITAWRAHVHPEHQAYILADAEPARRVIERWASVDPAQVVTALGEACGISPSRHLPTSESAEMRRQTLGPALSLSYDQPVHLATGDGVWLTETDGTRLLDAYNNVPHVGHAHPEVAGAISRQVHRLSTNTRYLVDEVTTYARRLTSTLPGDLSVVMFVNSGSEANDLAYQIARTVTGRRGVVVTDHAYHGTTLATALLSPEEIDERPSWVTTIDADRILRAGNPLRAGNAAELIGGELDTALDSLSEQDEAPAMLILDDVFSSDGIHTVRPGFLRTAYERVRRAGGLCVADEVQAGFGRVGTPFWGFAQDEVVPDIVTLGKPMGNGYPIGAVVTTPEIARDFASGWHFFSTFAGSPVAAAAGSAVLNVIERERLAERAEEIGDYLRSSLNALSHDVMLDVRGPGLFVGVELDSAARADTVCNLMRRDGVLIGTTGKNGAVLKIRPPLTFAQHHADLLIETLERALTKQERRGRSSLPQSQQGD